MGRASVIGIEKTAITVEHNRKRRHFERERGIEEPEVLHADLVWPEGAATRYEVKFPGEELPDELIVRDGAAPGFHAYR